MISCPEERGKYLDGIFGGLCRAAGVKHFYTHGDTHYWTVEGDVLPHCIGVSWVDMRYIVVQQLRNSNNLRRNSVSDVVLKLPSIVLQEAARMIEEA